MNASQPLWSPNPAKISHTRITAFIDHVKQQYNVQLGNYETLYQWSVENNQTFWSALWDFGGVIGHKGERVLINEENIEEAQWFPDATLNFAENLLKRRDDEIAIYFQAEDKVSRTLTYKDLFNQVANIAQWLKTNGLKPGDRVAAYMPNMPETIVAMLAATSLGAIWTSTSPDFGEESVVDRFGQTEPRFLFTVDGYFYNGKTIDIRAKIDNILPKLPSIEKTIQINFTGFKQYPGAENWAEICQGSAESIEFAPRKFNDPLYVLYSSGTTGKPKCITHSVGGVLLQHIKEHQLHSDTRPGDCVFFFTTCGWMMWNWLVTALACEASVVLYDGSPFYPDGNVLWDYADKTDMTLFGTSAKFIDAMKKAELAPINSHRLEHLRTLCSTGSVLAPESFDYVYQAIKSDICLSSISGGTDICSCFVLGCPILPVYRGESQCRGLGMAVEVYDDDGNTVVNQKGELVCTNTFPSQPVFFWGDDSGEKYHNAYFATYPNIWHHGDYVSLTDHGGMIIFGRSDATLNPGGVRIGTAEIYRHVEQLDEVNESIVIGQEWESDVRVVLFVVLKAGLTLDEALIQKIRLEVREKCTPRHMPAKVIQVTEIPRTKSGKIVELAVREIVHNRPVKNIHSLSNPDALNLYQNLSELTS